MKVHTRAEPPEKFVDEQLLGPYAFWHHTQTFAETAVGGTRLGDVVRYALPLGPLGTVAHTLVVRRRLEGIFAHRRRAVAVRFGTGKE